MKNDIQFPKTRTKLPLIRKKIGIMCILIPHITSWWQLKQTQNEKSKNKCTYYNFLSNFYQFLLSTTDKPI